MLPRGCSASLPHCCRLFPRRRARLACIARSSLLLARPTSANRAARFHARRARHAASAGVGPAIVCLRSVPAEPRAPTRAGHAGGARAPPLTADSHPRGRNDRPRPISYVANVCFRGMLQAFHMNVAEVDRDVAYSASVSEACCKRLFKMFHLFQTYVASILVWMLYMFHTYVARVCSKCFSCFQSYVAINVFMLQAASVLSKFCICFTHMFQVYVSFDSDICCIQLFYISEVESY
jgi:hypothetical protein